MNQGTFWAFLVSLLLQVTYPLAIALAFRRRSGAEWQVFANGAMVFAAFQLFSWLPLSVYLDYAVGGQVASGWASFLWLMTMAIATSLVEEAGRWAGFRFLFPRGPYRLTWRNGVMYGLGQGAIESLLLIAGLTFVNFVAYVLLCRLDLPAFLSSVGEASSAPIGEALQSIVDTAWHQPIVVAVERMLALFHQVAWALLVMESHVSRQKRWFGFAVLYHASVAIIVPGLARLFGFAAAESVNLLLAGLSLWIILRLRAVSENRG